jgi:hypothetical protein
MNRNRHRRSDEDIPRRKTARVLKRGRRHFFGIASEVMKKLTRLRKPPN